MWPGYPASIIIVVITATTTTSSASTLPHPVFLQCDWVLNITWVDAKGEIHTAQQGSDEARGLCGGIGLLGVITELSLQLTEPTNTRLSTWYIKDDANIADDVDKMLKVRACPKLGALWRRSAQTAEEQGSS